MKSIITQIKSQGAGFRNLAPCLMVLLLVLGGGSAFSQTLLTQDFESATFPPTGWTSSTSNASYPWARVGSFTGSPSIAAHGGSAMARYNSYSAGTGSTAELRTPALNFSGSSQVVVSFWMYRDPGYSGYTNEKIDVFVNTTPTSVGGALIGSVVRWNGGIPTVGGTGWYLYTFNVPTTFTGTTNHIIFKATSQFGNDMFLDDIHIYNLAPCTGIPIGGAGTISPSGTTNNVCPGTSYTLSNSGYVVASGISHLWMYSTNGGTTWAPAPGVNNTPSYNTGPLTQNTRYHVVVSCVNGGVDSTANAIFNVLTGFPTYATLPFFESFESWKNGCNTSDLPSNNWTNSPATGNRSFRRDDQGSTASWSTPTGGAYTPTAALGSYSARFHAYSNGTRANNGTLSAYVDCSATGNKELQFYIRTDPNTYTMDSIYVDYSMNGGATFTNLARYGMGTGRWDFKTLVLPSNSATTVVRWTYWQEYQYTGYGDMGLDGVRILPPCAGKPVAGVIDTLTACPNKNFTLSLTGTTSAAGLTYTWQSKPAGSTVGWSNLPGGNVARPTANIGVPTLFRAIVSCSNATPTIDDTSAVYQVNLAPFYYCYCNTPSSISYPQYNYGGIGNVSIDKRPSNVNILNNGNASPSTNNPGAGPGYISYARTVPAPVLIRDSTYRFSITGASSTINFIASTYYGVFMFLDWNRNGVWDLPQERIMNKTLTNTATPTNIQDFKIPGNAQIGLTGMRAMAGYYITTTPPVDPCGAWYYNAEAEDYLVYIEYKPCDGPVTAGTAYISDTSVCPGYTVDIWDTGYQKDRTGINRIWQSSTNGGASFNNITGSLNTDTLFNVVVPASSFGVRYRLAIWCGNTGDTTYSNSLSVSNPPASSCYPFASAMPPGTNDSSDIGSFVIGPVSKPYINPAPMSVSGPHLANPAANRRRTDYTRVGPWNLAADSTYRISVFHTMRSLTHADAMVSVFIDFNRDGLYTEASPGFPFPPELIFRGRTTATNFYLDTLFKMPSTMIGGVSTGLRVVLNNDLDLNQPNNGNNGRGGFISGEVEDYTVILSRNNLGTGGVPAMVRNMSLYPNPTGGRATLSFETGGAGVRNLEVTVTTITGQRVMSSSYENVGARFTAELNLSGKAKGIYFVEVNADGEKTTQKLVIQ